MAFAPLLLTAGQAIAGASAIAAVGSIYSGFQQANQYSAMANNADANARNTRLQANANEESQRRENKLRMGLSRAAAAESGFDPNSGTLADLQVRSAQQMELDAMTDRYNSELQAISFQNEASSLRSQAKASKVTGFLNAAGTVFQGATGYGRAEQKVPSYDFSRSGYGGRY